jgi:hypothetical protein
MQEVFTTLDFASAFTVGLNFSLIVNSFNEVVTSIESGSDLPVISYSEAVQLVGDMVNYIAGNLLIGGDLSTYFAGVLLDLRSGMALGTSADSMQGLYNGVIDASSMPGYVKSVIKDAAYHALYSYYFDPGTSPALGGFDGSACGGALTDITECTEFQATEQTISGVLYYIVSLPPSYGPFPPAIEGDYFGWSFLITGDESSKMSVYYWDLSDSIQLEVEQFVPDEPAAHVMTHHSHAIIIQSDDSGDRAPFGVIICPPE